MGKGNLIKAVQRGDAKGVASWLQKKNILGKFPSPDTLIDRETILTIAAKDGYKDVVEVLLKAGAQVDLFDPSSGGECPLRGAARNGQKEVVEMLLKAGAGQLPSAGYASNGRVIDEALNEAAMQGHEKVVEVLFRAGASVDRVMGGYIGGGYTPLRWAASNGHKGVVEVLIRAKANVNLTNTNARYGFGFDDATPLHEAAYYGHKEIVEMLLRVGAYVDPLTRGGYTPLHYAAAAGYKQIATADYKDIVEMLYNAGANHQIMTKDGITPLEEAQRNGHTAVVDFLRDLPACKKVTFVFLSQKNGLSLSNLEQKITLPNSIVTARSAPTPATMHSLPVVSAKSQKDFISASKANLESQDKASTYYARAKLATMKGNRDAAIENYFLARDSYKTLATKGVDCKKRLEKIKTKLNDLQSKLATIPQSPAPTAAATAAPLASFWYFKCKNHAAIVTGEKRQNKETADADLRQHEQTEHAGEHVGKIKPLHL